MNLQYSVPLLDICLGKSSPTRVLILSQNAEYFDETSFKVDIAPMPRIEFLQRLTITLFCNVEKQVNLT